MLSSFPKQIYNKAIAVYLVTVIIVSVVFMSNIMSLKFMLIGFCFVFVFFYFSFSLTGSWKHETPKVFKRNLFGLALLLRVCWVIFSYNFYIANTGQPFEWEAADSFGYHDTAKWFSFMKWKDVFNWLIVPGGGVSDIGYLVYLTFLYKVMGPEILVVRLLKAIFGAWMCILFYKLSARTLGESTGKIAGLFCALMPNLIIYCGIHTKEIEMLFCCSIFLERADYLLRTRNYSITTVLIPTIFAFSLFFFRTVLGVVAIFSFFTALMFNSERVVKKGKKIILSVWMASAVVVLAGGTIMNEVEQYWNLRDTNEIKKRESQSHYMEWAKYATGTVMAPVIFILPFSTMVDTQQYNQNVVHGGNFVKNFLGIFVLFALYYAVQKKAWRNFSLIGAFTIGYLCIVAFSGYANAERFHFPALPCVLVMAAYGVSQLNNKNLKYVNLWCFAVLLMEFAWTFFKLGGRGLVAF